MKSKKALLWIVMTLLAQVAFAQSVSDEEVLAMGKRLKAGGDDNKTIVQKVLAAGATREQLERLQNEKSKAKASAGSANDGTPRTNNAEQTEPDFFIPEESGRRIFGRDIFRTKELSFEPNTAMAIGSDYVVGPGDELIVDISGASQSSNKYKVSPEGLITIPRIGPISVTGMSVEAAQQRIHNAMGQHYQNSSIKLSVGQTRTINISVMGEVAVPGSYKLSAFATVFHALYLAGGTSPIGTLRDIKVARNGRIISTIDIYEYILNGRLAGDVKLKDNDVIMVGSYVNMVNISGNVKRPMWYEMKKGETVKTILDYAGGFSGGAYTKNVTVTRRAGDRLSVNTVDEFDFGAFVLADEDSIIVQGNEQRYENIVTINGAVKRPSQYGLTKVNTLRGLLEAAGGLQEYAVQNRGVLTRMNEDRTFKTITINPLGILEGTIPDIPLYNEDVITIASKAISNDNRTVRIEGDVWAPGTFPFATNTNIGDLITLAGGLKESAATQNVEVARRIIDPDATTDQEFRSLTYTFNLNNDLTLQNGAAFELQPYDIVYIRRSPVYNEQHSVSVTGEVMFAGNFVLENHAVRLSDIIKRAGGLKRNSSAHNARLTRLMTAEELERKKDLIALSHRTNDTLSVSDTTEARVRYTVAIDLQKALENPGGPEDIVLRDYDVLNIPSIVNTITVNGEVLSPNTITYLEGKGYRHYIDEAGGTTNEAARRRAYIVYANGHIAKARRHKIEPGCEIFVPQKRERKNNPMNTATTWISITSAIATTAAVILTAIKK